MTDYTDYSRFEAAERAMAREAAREEAAREEAGEAMVVRGAGAGAVMYGPRPVPATATAVDNGRVFDMHEGPDIVGTFRVVATEPDPEMGAPKRYCVRVGG